MIIFTIIIAAVVFLGALVMHRHDDRGDMVMTKKGGRGMGDEEKKVNPSYVEWLEQVVVEY